MAAEPNNTLEDHDREELRLLYEVSISDIAFFGPSDFCVGKIAQQ